MRKIVKSNGKINFKGGLGGILFLKILILIQME
jgi:hypothetical protein